MKPILFPEGQRDFSTNGPGRLSDAISCKVTEERNGQYELHMEYPIDGWLIEEVKYSRIIYATTADGKYPQPFRIYRITKPLSGVVEIDGEHISYTKDADGNLIIVEEEARVVRRIFRDYLEGSSFRDIAEGLERDGIKNADNIAEGPEWMK